jgi:2-polyprenyl-3-methyl-5-hydroxy-6-metoxy-1,4-benzoquinol methylase
MITSDSDLTKRIAFLVSDTLDLYRIDPVDLLNIGDGDGEYRYLESHRHQYERTIQDICTHFIYIQAYTSVRILELGSFLGLVSIVLSRLGFSVTAADIDEFTSCTNLQNKFKAYDVNYVSCNLRHYSLPFGSEEYDVVIMCETLEHLNFNPLPVIKEINRVIKTQGLLYLMLPNIARIDNRLKLLSGQSIHNPIADFKAQLDANDNMIVGLHWREYTIDEIKEMLELMSFTVIDQYYNNIADHIIQQRGFARNVKASIYRVAHIPFIDRLVQRLINYCLFHPDDMSLQYFQVNRALKNKKCEEHFHFTDATVP